MKNSAKHAEAAVLLAEDHLLDSEIAEKVGVHRVTLARWKQKPEFRSLVEQHAETLNAKAAAGGISRKARRINALQQAYNKLMEVVEKRADAPEMSEVPGGKTGLIVRKAVVSAGVLVGYEYAVDHGTIRELRSILEQTAKETGQLVERKEVKLRSLKDLSDEELEALIAEADEELGDAR